MNSVAEHEATSGSSRIEAAQFSGIYPMLLPFYDQAGELALEPVRQQVEAAVKHGCHGLPVMGLGSEMNKLSLAERRRLLETTAEALAGRLPLSVTVAERTVSEQIEFAQSAAQLGADWVILQPPTVTDVAEIELQRFFGAIADALEIPVAIQNASMYLGVGLSNPGLKELHRQHPNISLLKTEDDPLDTAVMMHETGGVFDLFVGRGGLDMLDELATGAVGIIPGMETLDRTTTAFNAYRDGNEEQARGAYREVESAIVFLEKSINHYVTYEREILSRRLGFDGVYHRLGKETTTFGIETSTRIARDLGPLLSSASSVSEKAEN